MHGATIKICNFISAVVGCGVR